MGTSINRRRGALCALGIAMLAITCNARAQMQRAVVFAPSSHGAADLRIVREARAAVVRLDLAKLRAEPALDLNAAQSKIDCVGESAECLSLLAQYYKADVVIAPYVVYGNGVTALRILFFDARSGEGARTAKHRVHGAELDAASFAAIPRLLRALFSGRVPIEQEFEPEPPAQDTAQAEPPATTPEPLQQTPQSEDFGSRSSLPVGPLVLGGTGVIVLGFGLAVGALMKEAQDDYAKRVVRTPDQAKQADDDVKFGRRQALTADVLMAVGAAAIATSVIWLVASGRDEPAPAQAALVPSVDRRGAMLAVSGVWDERL